MTMSNKIDTFLRYTSPGFLIVNGLASLITALVVLFKMAFRHD